MPLYKAVVDYPVSGLKIYVPEIDEYAYVYMTAFDELTLEIGNKRLDRIRRGETIAIYSVRIEDTGKEIVIAADIEEDDDGNLGIVMMAVFAGKTKFPDVDTMRLILTKPIYMKKIRIADKTRQEDVYSE